MSKIHISVFRVNDDTKLYQYLDLADDSVSIQNKFGNHIGLSFDSCCNVIFNDKIIGKLRLPFGKETKNIHFVLYDSNSPQSEKECIDTNVSEKDAKCYLKAEVFITKYLIDNNHIQIT